jgi:hypothetical protein
MRRRVRCEGAWRAIVGMLKDTNITADRTGLKSRPSQRTSLRIHLRRFDGSKANANCRRLR